MSSGQSPNQNVAPGRPTTVEPLPEVAKLTHKVCKKHNIMVYENIIILPNPKTRKPKIRLFVPFFLSGGTHQLVTTSGQQKLVNTS